jgi:predicted DCC family thiol-disulfide oxidoreductase YuxK
MGKQAELLLIYDGRCVLCRRTVKQLESIKVDAKLEMVSLQTVEANRLPERTTRESLHAQLHVLDEKGQIFKGPDAVFRILREVPSLRPISWLYGLPGMRQLAKVVYRWIARHRYKLFGKVEDDCQDGSCEWHPRK